jgi:hypothetical protein
VKDDERDLASLLDRVVGEPPSGVDLAAVRATARRQRRVLVLATAAGTLAVTGGAAALGLSLGSPDRAAVQELPGSPSPDTTASAPATTVSPASAGACSGSAASASILSSEGAAGTIRWAVQVRNTGSTPCHVDGYPVLAFHATSGWVHPTTTHGGYGDISASPTPITVAAGGSAYFVAYFSDATTSAGPCTTFDEASATLPDDETAMDFPAGGCVSPSMVRVGPLISTRPM